MLNNGFEISLASTCPTRGYAGAGNGGSWPWETSCTANDLQ